MKYIFTLFLGVAFVFSSTSQLSKLDDKHGFKSLKLGTQKSQMVKSITYHKKDNDGNSMFNYTGTDSDLKKVFNYSVSELLLTFDKNTQKLVEIAVKINVSPNGSSNVMERQLQILESLTNNFTQLFGQPSGSSQNEEYSSFITAWQAQKTLLMVFNMYMGFDQTSHVIVLIQAKKKQNLEDGF